MTRQIIIAYLLSAAAVLAIVGMQELHIGMGV